MEKISVEELKKIQINILLDVAKFCDENGINYFLDAGTLLGAVRHKGYIPWDDDIDIGMLREDYNIFIDKYKSKKNYECMSIEKGNHPYPFAKVLDRDTILYEPNEKGIKYSVNIDIFVYDYVPEDKKTQDKIVRKRDFLSKLNLLRIGWIYSDKKFVYLLKKVLSIFLKVFPKYYFTKQNLKLIKKYSSCKTNYVIGYTGSDRAILRKVLEEYIEIEFENYYFKVPKNYDAWLTTLYGDYMSLPPLDKQVSHHKFIAYKK